MSNSTLDEIKAIIFQLPIEQMRELMEEIEQKVETNDFMLLAETGFSEWNEPEEDIYNDETTN